MQPAWVRETPCNCWVKGWDGAHSLPVTAKNFMKAWFFVNLHRGRAARFFYAWRFVD